MFGASVPPLNLGGIVGKDDDPDKMVVKVDPQVYNLSSPTSASTVRFVGILTVG